MVIYINASLVQMFYLNFHLCKRPLTLYQAVSILSNKFIPQRNCLKVIKLRVIGDLRINIKDNGEMCRLVWGNQLVIKTKALRFMKIFAGRWWCTLQARFLHRLCCPD